MLVTCQRLALCVCSFVLHALHTVHGQVQSVVVTCHNVQPQRTFLQVVDGMTVSNLKDKLWNMTGFAPLRQRLVLPNGGELSDTMDFIDCGLQPGDRLALRIS